MSYKKMKKPTIGSMIYEYTSDDGYDVYSKVVGVRKGSLPFRGYFPYYFTTTKTVRKQSRKKSRK